MPSRSNSAWLSSMSNRVREEIATIRGSASRSGMAPLCRRPVSPTATATGSPAVTAGPLRSAAGELLGQHPFFQVVLRVEQQGHGAIVRLADGDLDHVAHLVRV